MHPLQAVSAFTFIHIKMHIDGKTGYSPSPENAWRTDTKANIRRQAKKKWYTIFTLHIIYS